MKTLLLLAALSVGSALAAPAAQAGACIAGGCHAAVVKAKFVHGPVAAEETGAEGCTSCHLQKGAACTATKGGQFEFKTKKERLCILCHERGTSTQHTRTRSDCLSCHNPHHSEQSKNLLRAGAGKKAK